MRASVVRVRSLEGLDLGILPLVVGPEGLDLGILPLVVGPEGLDLGGSAGIDEIPAIGSVGQDRLACVLAIPAYGPYGTSGPLWRNVGQKAVKPAPAAPLDAWRTPQPRDHLPELDIVHVSRMYEQAADKYADTADKYADAAR